MTATTTLGTIKPKGTLILREQVGEAEAENGNSYELTTSVSSGQPIVRSQKTGKWFLLSWQEIIDLAVEAGVDLDEPQTAK